LQLLRRGKVDIRESGYVPRCGYGFRQDFLPFSVQLAGQETDAREITARLGQRTHQARSEQIRAVAKDGDGSRRLLSGANRQLPGTNKEIDLSANELFGMFGVLLGTQPISAFIDHKVLPLDETLPLQLVIERDMMRALRGLVCKLPMR
jgi:hypothetical protein